MDCIRHPGTSRHLPGLWFAFTPTPRMAASAATGFPRTWRRGHSGTPGLPLTMLASACPRRTLSDHIPSIARPFARRTSRVREIVSHLGHATGGRPAERLLHRLGVGVSDDTVLRQLKHRAQDAAQPPRAIGIDDWSWRKPQTYVTINVDLERRSL